MRRPGGQAMPFYKNFLCGGPGSVRGYEGLALARINLTAMATLFI